MMPRHTRRDSIHCLIEELMLIPDVLLHKEEEEEKKRKKKKKKLGMCCALWFRSSSMGGLSGWLSHSPCLCRWSSRRYRVESLWKRKQKIPRPFLLLSLYVPCLLPFSLVLIPRVRVIDRSFLFDGWGRQEKRQSFSLSFGVTVG